ncbi:MAG: carbohydrate kinase family protein, partial [Candidatus Nanopelagicales bacterium]
MNRSGVLCVGTAIVDVGKVIEAYPVLDHLVIIDEVFMSTGGAALNLSSDLRYLGAQFPVAVLAAIGEDENGRYILDECLRLGVERSAISVLPDVVTSFTDAMVEREGGRRTFFHYLGANAQLDASGFDIEGSSFRILHVGIPGLHPLMDAVRSDGSNGWADLMRRARRAGIHVNLELTSLAPEKVREVALPFLGHCDTVIINELEAGALTGIESEAPGADGPVDWASLESMARGLIELGVQSMAVVHFPAGAVAATADGRMIRQGSVRVPLNLLRSTTGAGDAFASGVLLGIHDGLEVEECLELGVAAAASCVQSPYTSRGLASAPECLAQA